LYVISQFAVAEPNLGSNQNPPIRLHGERRIIRVRTINPRVLVPEEFAHVDDAPVTKARVDRAVAGVPADVVDDGGGENLIRLKRHRCKFAGDASDAVAAPEGCIDRSIRLKSGEHVAVGGEVAGGDDAAVVAQGNGFEGFVPAAVEPRDAPLPEGGIERPVVVEPDQHGVGGAATGAGDAASGEDFAIRLEQHVVEAPVTTQIDANAAGLTKGGVEICVAEQATAFKQFQGGALMHLRPVDQRRSLYHRLIGNLIPRWRGWSGRGRGVWGEGGV